MVSFEQLFEVDFISTYFWDHSNLASPELAFGFNLGSRVRDQQLGKVSNSESEMLKV